MGRLKVPPKTLGAPLMAIGYATRLEAERARDKLRRRNAGDSLRGLYNTKRWRHPDTGVLLTGKAPVDNSPIVDQIEPHRGNLLLFWDEANLRAVSKAWHDSEKQRQERAAQVGG